MWRHLIHLSLPEWRHHPWRHAAALLAVALGVALASSVQMINESALGEFAQAVRSVNGQPDAVLAGASRDGFDDALYARVLLDEGVAGVSPVLEIDSAGRWQDDAPADAAAAPPTPLRVVGIDALKVATIAPALMPQPGDSAAASTPGLALLLAPDTVFLNPAARKALGSAASRPGARLALRTPAGWVAFSVGGLVSAGGSPLLVMDIAAAQTHWQRNGPSDASGPGEAGAPRGGGRLSRLDIRLLPGIAPADWQRRFEQAQPLPAGVRWAVADEAVQRVSNLSRAYRVNLGVLALVALLVGGFLVYSVVSLSVAQRTPSLALLGVLGLAARDRRRLVLVESLVVGTLGSLLGLAAGAGLAALALRLLGGDLGGGYFAGAAPSLAWPWPALALCGGLGVAAAVAGAWWPARQASGLSPALALKGLGGALAGRATPWPGLGLLVAGGGLALLPPVAGLPLAAYAAVATLLAGGVVLVPAVVQAVVGGLLRRQGLGALPLLALRRAHFARQAASATVAGVVASLALSVAITVMVASFRDAVIAWLGSALPADLYLRPAGGAADGWMLPPDLPARAAALPGVQRVAASRQRPMLIQPEQPPVMLMTRALGAGTTAAYAGTATVDTGTAAADTGLPLLGPALPLPAGELGVYVSEPAAALHGWAVGAVLQLPIPGAAAGTVAVRVLGVWRDYARQFGAVVIDAGDYQRLTGDTRLNDLAVWLAPGAAAPEVEAALRRLTGPELPLEIASTSALRQLSLRIFDRSFAVTLYLQAVAIGVGLVGVAASLSAQVLARRKDFGLLAHLGLTRRQVITLVGAEAAAWLLAGALIGLLLGLLMALVLVHVVNPQSFHWTMPLRVPVARLAALAAAVLVAGVATALWSARRAAGRSAVLAVKEDW